MSRRKHKKLPAGEFQATVTHLSHDGRGIAKIDGKTTFLFGALPNEEVKFQYTNRRSTFDEGSVTEVLSPSPDRIDPQCAHFGVCGGCSLQHMKPELQVDSKQAAFLELLQHQAQVQPKSLLPPLTANAWQYRRKARLSAKYVAPKEKVVVGFREKNGRFIANIGRCNILHASIGEHIEDIGQALYQLECRDKIPQVEIVVDDTDTAIIVRHMAPLLDEDINALRTLAEKQGYRLYLQSKGPDTITLNWPENAPVLMHYSLSNFGVEFDFHPAQFTQINTEINHKMVACAIELLELTEEDSVLDLFCGIGNFTLPIAKHCLKVVGVEGQQSAVDMAKHNATINNINNTKFYCSNLFEPLAEQDWSLQHYTKLVLDPPRAGAAEVIQALNMHSISTIVYISCNPATLARDTKLLVDRGYRLIKAGVMDMFPHTQHVEAMALFKK
jgi:23S rRNA (uracil1939-C5)-methyltransferase